MLRGGQKLVVETTITGIPTATASWSMNDQPLEPSHHVAIETSAMGSKLTLTDVKAECTGVYKLTAENTVGSATAEFDIVVKGERCRMMVYRHKVICCLSQERH